VRAVEVTGGNQQAHALLALRGERSQLELIAHAGRQLGRRLLGERDHHQLVDVHLAAREQLDHPVDEHRRLAGPRGGLDCEIGVEVVGDPVAGRLVGQHRRAHGTLLTCSTNSENRSSPALRFTYADRADGQIELKSQ